MGERSVEYGVLERILARTEDPRNLDLGTLKSITNEFSEDRKIGSGGFGEVYKGDLPNGSVAVKKIILNKYTIDDKLFYGEVISFLKTMDHPNVVRFVGFCSTTHNEIRRTNGSQEFTLPQIRERLLCFEYVSNGSLDKHITDELRGLDWNIRYQIIKGICEGLQHLHETIKIVHMDLKPANIMVDTDMVPKISDFGQARAEGTLIATEHRFITQGYTAPEYKNDGIATKQCDIYSLGVIIIELVTGRNSGHDKNRVLRKWTHRWTKSSIHTPLQAQVTTCIETAERCIDKDPRKRPSVSDIIHKLDGIGAMNNHIPIIQSPYDMLDIEPLELCFAFEPSKEISIAVVLTNQTSNGIAFNIKTLSPLQYCTQPNKGIVKPRSKSIVNIILQAQELPLGFKLDGDTFIVQSTKVEDDAGITDKNIIAYWFDNKAGNVVDEVNVTVVYDMSKKAQLDAFVYKDNSSKRLNFHPPQKLISATKRNDSSRAGDPAVDITTGAMGGLLPKVRELLRPDHNLGLSVKKDVKTLKRLLSKLNAGLCVLSQVQPDQLNALDKDWAKFVMEMSYNIEDDVDDLLVCIKGYELTTNKIGLGWLTQKMLNFITGFKGQNYRIAHIIKDLSTQVKEVADRPDAYKFGDFVAKPAVDPRTFPFYNDHSKLVGVRSMQKQLEDKLTGGYQQRLRIISICGDGGLGKTTLAKKVFDTLNVKFLLKAFVPVGRNPNHNEVLKNILYQLTKKTYADFDSQTLLINELHQVLDNRRYIIVIDDIWDRTTWNIIQRGLIDNNHGSRIITTSRNFEAVENSEVCKLEPLPDVESRELFHAILSGSEGSSNFDQPDEEQFNEILQKCGGVPLAIITMATLLAGRPRKEWTRVYNSIGFGGDVVDTIKILEFSYHDLPSHLKTCLLHLTIFREDHEIEKTTLVWKWIAEGFVREEAGETLFKVGERYFNQLINRSMILPIADTCSIYACRVHDMVLDMIRSLAEKQNFVTILDGTEANLFSESNARIQALHMHSVQHWDFTPDITCKLKSKVRSFNSILAYFNLRFVLPIFKALRVLSMERGGLTGYGPNYLDYLLPSAVPHLRYLGLQGTRVCWLPTDIGGFKYLQTLDLRGTDIEILPQSVILLKQLKCLRSDDRAMRLPDGMGNLTSLEELRLEKVVDSPNFVKELGKLTELRVLHIVTYMFRDNMNKTLVESLSKLQKMEELELCDGGRCDEPNWDCFKPSTQLRHLRLHNIRQSDGLPAWISPSLLPLLTHLDMAVPSATQQDTKVLGSFRELRFLHLYIKNKSPVHAVIAAGAFPKLRHCYMGPMLLKYLPGAMPCLESLQLHVAVRELKNADSDFDFDSLQHLPLLDKVHATINCWHAKTEEAKEAEDAVRRAVKAHPQCPTLGLQKVALCADVIQAATTTVMWRKFHNNNRHQDWRETTPAGLLAILPNKE